MGDAFRSGIILFRLSPMEDPSPALRQCRHVFDREVEALHTWYLALSAAVAGASAPPPPTGEGAADPGPGRIRYLGDPGPRSELSHRLAFAWAGEHLDILHERQTAPRRRSRQAGRRSGDTPAGDPWEASVLSSVNPRR